MDKLRLVVLVDMPTNTRHERKVAREFKEWLFKDGFSELQLGVFTRVADGRTNARMHEERLRAHQPETGPVRLFTMTERQFATGALIAGEESAQECEIGSQLDIFL